MLEGNHLHRPPSARAADVAAGGGRDLGHFFPSFLEDRRVCLKWNPNWLDFDFLCSNIFVRTVFKKINYKLRLFFLGKIIEILFN